jgi:PAS domain S-box-containing protein
VDSKPQDSFARQSEFLIRLKREHLETLPWGITKTNRQGTYTYSNRAICEIAGVESLEGKKQSDLFEGPDLAVVREHLESRFSRRAADEYKVELTRPDGVRVPVLCSAIPETNELGEVVGAIAIYRDLLMQDVSAMMHQAIEQLPDSRTIFEEVAKECHRVIPFDLFSITLYSADQEHYRLLYLYPEEGFIPSVRWTEMTYYDKQFVEARQALNVANFEEWLDQPKWRHLRDQLNVQQFLASGFHSFVTHPVIVGNRVVATVAFSRTKDKGPFTRQDEERLRQLPLDPAVSMALQHEKTAELKFTLDLIRRIASASESTEGIASVLTEEIAKHYEWENVFILWPDEQDGCLRLVKQQAQKESDRLSADYHHPIDQGVTGHVYRTRETLNVSDVKDRKFKDLYIPVHAEARSELCIPIIVTGRVYWLFNLESSKINAFAKEEQEALENILREVALVLELTSQTQIFGELLKHSKDAVIQTDFKGIIKKTNPATEELLGYSEAEMKGTPFDRYLKDKDQARRVEEAKYVPNDEVHLLHKNGAEVSLLLSKTSLPKEIGLKVYVCNDLSPRKRKVTIEILRQMYNEIASQIKTPLSLAFTWLDKLQKIESQPGVADILAKTVKQLHKVDLSYDRLLFYEQYKTIAPVEKSVFEIPFLIEKIKQDMPDSEAQQVEVITQTGVPMMVQADLFQLWFCVETVLAYLLRFVPASGKVSVNISARNGGVTLVIRGYAPRVTGGAITNYGKTRWAIRAITEMALGEEMIKRFVEKNNSGRFHKQRHAGDLMEYVIELPGT